MLTYIKVQVKQSRNRPGVAQRVTGPVWPRGLQAWCGPEGYRPGVAQRVPGGLGFQIS
jgi:hypothetical protein